MPTTTTIGVTTADAAPAVAPHKISNKTGKSTATLVITPTSSVGRAINAIRVRLGGSTAYTGTLVGGKGLVSSDSEPCAEALACTDWSSASGAAIAEDVTYAETGGPADGAQTVNVWVATDQEGWA